MMHDLHQKQQERRRLIGSQKVSTISVRLSLDDRDRIEDAAAAENMNLSEYVLWKALGDRPKRRGRRA